MPLCCGNSCHLDFRAAKVIGMSRSFSSPVHRFRVLTGHYLWKNKNRAKKQTWCECCCYFCISPQKGIRSLLPGYWRAPANESGTAEQDGCSRPWTQNQPAVRDLGDGHNATREEEKRRTAGRRQSNSTQLQSGFSLSALCCVSGPRWHQISSEDKIQQRVVSRWPPLCFFPWPRMSSCPIMQESGYESSVSRAWSVRNKYRLQRAENNFLWPQSKSDDCVAVTCVEFTNQNFFSIFHIFQFIVHFVV